MRFLRRSLVGLFLLSLTVGILVYSGQMIYDALQKSWAQETPTRPARERVFAVNVVTVTPQTITPVLTSFGEVRSRRTLDIRATSSGAVVAMAENFEDGGSVGAGDLLFAVDPADAQAALDVARTDLTEAEAELRDASRALDLAHDDVQSAAEQLALRSQALVRQRSLLDRGAGTEAAVEAAALAEASAKQAELSRRQALAQVEARLDQAATGLARRKIALTEAERRLAETRVHAEFAGTLSDVVLVQGGVVQTNERVARLIDADRLEVAFRVSTPQYARLLAEEGGALLASEVEVALDVMGVDLTSRGTISRESAAVGEGQTGRQLFARLTEARGFRPGDFVSVRIEEPELRGVARLPATAVDAAGTVLVIGGDERLELAEVEVLRRQGDDVIVRARGLGGRDVVAERSPLLGAGIKVRAFRPDAAAVAQPEAPEMVELTDERRARLVAFIEGNQFMPQEAKQRVLGQLQQPTVPAQVVARIESRMGG